MCLTCIILKCGNVFVMQTCNWHAGIYFDMWACIWHAGIYFDMPVCICHVDMHLACRHVFGMRAFILKCGHVFGMRAFHLKCGQLFSMWTFILKCGHVFGMRALVSKCRQVFNMWAVFYMCTVFFCGHEFCTYACNFWWAYACVCFVLGVYLACAHLYLSLHVKQSNSFVNVFVDILLLFFRQCLHILQRLNFHTMFSPD